MYCDIRYHSINQKSNIANTFEERYLDIDIPYSPNVQVCAHVDVVFWVMESSVK